MNNSRDNEVGELKKWESAKILPKKIVKNIINMYFLSCSLIY